MEISQGPVASHKASDLAGFQASISHIRCPYQYDSTAMERDLEFCGGNAEVWVYIHYLSAASFFVWNRGNADLNLFFPRFYIVSIALAPQSPQRK